MISGVVQKHKGVMIFEVYSRCLEFIIQHKYLPSLRICCCFSVMPKKYCIRMKIAKYILVLNDSRCIRALFFVLSIYVFATVIQVKSKFGCKHIRRLHRKQSIFKDMHTKCSGLHINIDIV